ncbi:hypothetical protein E5J99_15885 [Hymenobacter elongatus]|uniref:Uncharacterized protein n=2 Tax=Hymenobacter elongatus TaxID=877208 RepID=A0A4Z0PI71_9BACT|nr:hypothetical protein E5J99_15885 [Hymenobacter elongatus]
MQPRNIARIALAIGFLLLIPLVAMQFTKEVVWDLFDFAVAGTLLFGTGLTYEVVASKGGNTAYRVAVGAAVAVVLLLVWTNLAVGLIGSENNPANLMYGGVLAVAISGALAARFRPRGMARTLLATALAQIGVAVLALLIGPHQVASEEAGNIVDILSVNAFFVVLWIGAALLFRRASVMGPAPEPTI